MTDATRQEPANTTQTSDHAEVNGAPEPAEPTLSTNINDHCQVSV